MRYDAAVWLYILLEAGDVAGPESGEMIRSQLAIKLIEIHACRSLLTGLDTRHGGGVRSLENHSVQIDRRQAAILEAVAGSNFRYLLFKKPL
jgi:hypothetical protein